MQPPPYTPLFPRPVLGVSACLLGERVRYDGGHKRHPFLVDVLAQHLDIVPFCPEAGAGLGVPRPPVQLVGHGAPPRALGVDDPGLDVTERLQAYARAERARLHGLSGFLFKQHSPSCGLRQVKLFAQPGRGLRRRGVGIFAAAVSETLPWLPAEEEDALDQPRRRAGFLTRLYVARRWQQLQDRGFRRADLVVFHEAHAELVMARSQAACRRLAGLAAAARDDATLDATADRYRDTLMRALAHPATPARHLRAQRALAAALAPFLSHRQRSDLAVRLRAFQAGRVSLDAVIATLRDLIARTNPPHASGLAYLYPFPDDLRAPVTRIKN